MARGTWTTESWNGSQWVGETPMYRPNENMALEKQSTQSKIKLADGSNAFFIPETKYVREPMTMQFLEIEASDAFISRLSGYVENNTYLKITDHLGTTHTGKFISLRQVWLTGVGDTMDIETVFEIE